MPRELKLYLWDMRGAGSDILKFTRNKNFEDSLADDLLRAAVERKLEIIGEALAQATQLYPEVKTFFNDEAPDRGLSQPVIHGYFSVNDDLIWSTVKVYLPRLLDQIETALNSIFS